MACPVTSVVVLNRSVLLAMQGMCGGIVTICSDHIGFQSGSRALVGYRMHRVAPDCRAEGGVTSIV